MSFKKKSTKPTSVFLAVPSYDTRIEWAAATAALNPTRRKDLSLFQVFANSSLLAFNFNQLWCTALNYQKEHNIKYFVMLHGDVVPEQYWLDKMIDIAEKEGADLLSVAIPVKDNTGLTSIALSSEDPYNPTTRLTLKQLHQLPETFTALDVCKLIGKEVLPLPWLQINTGCLLVRIDRTWAKELYFTIKDGIRQNTDGTYVPVVLSEDWFFSNLANQHHAKVMATRAIRVDHIGAHKYPNDEVWGADWDKILIDKLSNSKKMDGTIWTLEEAKLLHVHSPGLAQWLVENLPTNETNVYDLGCGKGTYLKSINDAGFICKGFEGTPDIQQVSDFHNIEEFDITKKLLIGGQGHVLCLEVLEHIEPEKEWLVLTNIKNICKDMLVLSWAVEGQNGHGHINCRNADYVVPTIENLGFKIDFVATMAARQAAVSNNGPEFFYNSLYVFRRV